MSLLIKYLLTTQYKNRLTKNQVNGFTMVELLIATIMSFLIITPILAFAVNILESDVREQAKASTELELQSAMDYIQQDISQAYYIYDGAGITALTTPTNQLLPVTNGIPVLVFWKRELVKNAIDVTTQGPCASPSTDDDDGNPSTTNLQKCDDTYVDSLVAYYLVKDPDNQPTKWCQPGTGSCPARIERWSIRDGAKNISGTYLCGTEGKDANCDTNFKRSLGMPYTKTDGTPDGTKFSISSPNLWARSSEGFDPTNISQVLLNYVDAKVITRAATPTFCLNTLGINPTASPTPSPIPTEINYRIGTNDQTTRLNFSGFSGCVDSLKNIAQITIRGDALRRNEAKNADCDPAKKSPYCPTVSGQIGGRSRFGQ